MSKGVDLGTGAAKRFVVGKLRGTLSDGVDDDALVAALVSGPTGGRVHSYPIPEDIETPAIVFGRYGAVDEAGPIGRNTPVAAATIRLQIKAICEGYDDEVIEEAAGIVNQLLDGRNATLEVLTASGALYGTFYVECTRESELLIDPEPEDNAVFQA
jgi:hypothetical protein